MEFQTKIVEKKKNPRARVAMVGVVLFIVAMILSVIHGYERYALWMFGAGMLMLIGGAIYARGDLSSVGVSDIDLVVDVAGIRIGEVRYALSAVADLEFVVEGYDGMVTPGTSNYRRNREDYLNGMGNYLYFVADGGKVTCRFYLGDPQHVQQLGALYKEFYSRRVAFVERTGGWRTFLFEAVTDAQWEDLMIQNGYK
jgi:hypothetical protein